MEYFFYMLYNYYMCWVFLGFDGCCVDVLVEVIYFCENLFFVEVLMMSEMILLQYFWVILFFDVVWFEDWVVVLVMLELLEGFFYGMVFWNWV